MDEAKQAFLRDAIRAVQQLEGQSCNPRVLVAQAILESGWGQSDLARKHHNYFGIKAGSLWQGKVAEYETREVINGQETTEVARFRAYDSTEQGLRDYLDFIASSPYFAEALSHVDDDSAYLDVLVGGEVKYATDPHYKQLILDIIETSNLGSVFPRAAKNDA